MRSTGLTALLAGLALAGSALLTASSPPDAEEGTTIREVSGTTAAKTVMVTFDPNSGKIRVSQDTVRITLGEEITWEPGSGVEALAIDIPDAREPFGQSVRANGLRGRKGGPPAHARARNNPDVKGTYKYTVAIYDGKNVWILDPEIVIN